MAQGWFCKAEVAEQRGVVQESRQEVAAKAVDQREGSVGRGGRKTSRVADCDRRGAETALGRIDRQRIVPPRGDRQPGRRRRRPKRRVEDAGDVGVAQPPVAEKADVDFLRLTGEAVDGHEPPSVQRGVGVGDAAGPRFLQRRRGKRVGRREELQPHHIAQRRGGCAKPRGAGAAGLEDRHVHARQAVHDMATGVARRAGERRPGPARHRVAQHRDQRRIDDVQRVARRLERTVHHMLTARDAEHDRRGAVDRILRLNPHRDPVIGLAGDELHRGGVAAHDVAEAYGGPVSCAAIVGARDGDGRAEHAGVAGRAADEGRASAEETLLHRNALVAHLRGRTSAIGRREKRRREEHKQGQDSEQHDLRDSNEQGTHPGKL